MLDSGALISLVHHFGQTSRSHPSVSPCHSVTVHFSLGLLFSERFRKPIFPVLWSSPWGVTSGWKMCSKCNLICGKSLYSFIFSLCWQTIWQGPLKLGRAGLFWLTVQGYSPSCQSAAVAPDARHTQEAEREWCRCSAYFTCFIQPGPQTHRRTEPHSRVASPPQLAQARSSLP